MEYIGEHGDEPYYFFIPCLLFNLVYTWGFSVLLEKRGGYIPVAIVCFYFGVDGARMGLSWNEILIHISMSAPESKPQLIRDEWDVTTSADINM